ncbi:MAG: geranylgeranyl reductase family protein [Nitrospinota bacterium]
MPPERAERGWDCLVVGAGPAGATAARRLALRGRSVLLLDAHRFPRDKCCAGVISETTVRALDFPLGRDRAGRDVVERKVSRVVFSYRGRWPRALEPRALEVRMVMREVFDNFLVEKAREAGAALWDGARALRLAEERDGVHLLVEREGERFSLRALAVIGADGARSVVARDLGLWRGVRFGGALSGEVRVPPPDFERAAPFALFDFGALPQGYAWVFPKREHLSTGVCSMAGGSGGLRRVFDGFLAVQPWLGRRLSVAVTGAGLPLRTGGPGQRLHGERAVVAGDAAGLVDPLTGEGIHHAVISGARAAEAVDDLLSGRASLAAYSERISSDILPDLHCVQKFASLLLCQPLVAYLAGCWSGEVRDLFSAVISGRLSYREAHGQLSRRWPVRVLGRVLPRTAPRATLR